MVKSNIRDFLVIFRNIQDVNIFFFYQVQLRTV